MVESAIERSKKIHRKAVPRKVSKKQNNKGPVFVVKYDPRLQPLGSIQSKHWRSMASRDDHLQEVFKRPPLIAYKRQQNIHQKRYFLDIQCCITSYTLEKNYIKIGSKAR